MLSPYVNDDDTLEIMEILEEATRDLDVVYEVRDVSSDYMEGGYIRLRFEDTEGEMRTYVLKVHEEV